MTSMLDEQLKEETPDPGSVAEVDTPAIVASTEPPTESAPPEIPDYLQEVYYWAYLHPRNVRLLDREWVVKSILWFQHKRLREAAFAELEPGSDVLQPACVYGDFSVELAKHIGPDGKLEVVDVAPIQLEGCSRKLAPYPQASVRLANSKQLGDRKYDAICCYFLLHELPEKYKHLIVDSLLQHVKPGGKVVFVDYHKPHWAHPLKLITSIVFDTLEPFAKGLWKKEISEFASKAEDFEWSKHRIFGGLYQRVVAVKKS